MRDTPLSAELVSLDTPALLVDLDLLDANIARIAGVWRKIRLRLCRYIAKNVFYFIQSFGC